MKFSLYCMVFGFVSISSYAHQHPLPTNNDIVDKTVTQLFKEGLYQGLKESMLEQYQGRCEEVLSRKHYNKQKVHTKCSCEMQVFSEYVDNNLLQKIYINAVLGKPLLTQQEKIQIQERNKMCDSI